MQQMDKYYVLNIRRLLEGDLKLGEEELKEYFSEFSCPLNLEVERFLREQSIDFVKKHQAVTYIVLSQEDGALVGYFAITIKPLVVNAESFSNTMKRKLARFSDISRMEESYNMAAYLIAQLGKNYDSKVADRITGKELLEIATEQLKNIQYEAGGMVSFVEAENNEKVLEFYENYGFKRFATRELPSAIDQQHELVQLLKLI